MDKQYQEFYDKGHADEFNAAGLINEVIGGFARPAPTELDKKYHTDILWESPKGFLCSIDKKMQKRKKRGDANYDPYATWIELRDNFGRKGWAYCQAPKLREIGYNISDSHDYVMIESPNSYLFIQRNKLLPFTINLIKGKELVLKNPRQINIPYRREDSDHKDVVVSVLFKDLESITQFKINKPCR